MAFDRTNFNALVDDSGAGADGTIWNKQQIEDVLIDQVDKLVDGTSEVTAVKFPATQVQSADVNTLDDYEEGLWTPTLIGTGGQSGQAYSLQSGSYVKIGKLVFFHGRLTMSTLGTVTTAAAIGGLPFTAETQYSTAHIGFWSGMTSSYVYLSGAITAGTARIELFGATAAATGLSAVVQGGLSNTSDFIFSGMFRASGA